MFSGAKPEGAGWGVRYAPTRGIAVVTVEVTRRSWRQATDASRPFRVLPKGPDLSGDRASNLGPAIGIVRPQGQLFQQQGHVAIRNRKGRRINRDERRLHVMLAEALLDTRRKEMLNAFFHPPLSQSFD